MILRYGYSKTKLHHILLLCAASVLSLLTGMNGLRYLMVFYAPLVIATVVLLIWHRDTLWVEGKWKLGGKRQVSFFTVAFIACLCATRGYLVAAVATNAAVAYHVLWQQDDTGELKAITRLLR